MNTQPESVPVAPSADPAFSPPSLGRRFGALGIDWLLCLLASNLFADPARDGWPPVVVLIGVYTLFVGLFAQTPGMFVTRLRCVNWADGGRIGVLRGLLRGVLVALLLPAFFMDEKRRGLQDRLVGSVVVSAAPAASRS